MKPEEMLIPPTAAMLDVERDEFEYFTDSFVRIKAETAQKALDALCNLHNVETDMDLVSKPFPNEGPMNFIENAENYRYLTKYEALVLEAVSSNTLAAIIFLERFQRQEFIAMEFFDIVLNEAIQTTETAAFQKKYLPDPNTDCEQGFQDKINKLTYIKKKVEKGAETNEWSHIKDLPKHYKFAAAQLPEELIDAIGAVIEHYERVLKRLKEIFAK